MDFTSLIEVRAPYFALQVVAQPRRGVVTAQATAELPPGYEDGLLPAAEAGRHLAIIGSCACASLAPNEGKHFYLAHRAQLRRVVADAVCPVAPLHVEAEAVQRDRKSASAHCVLRDAHERPLFALDVSYKVLAERVFQRLFSAHRRDLRTRERSGADDDASASALLRQNPYLQPLPLRLSELTGDAGLASLPEVPSELCAGHFPMYPAMPIALLMHGLSSLSGEVLRARHGANTRYVVTSADVRADRLAFAGQSLTFSAHWQGYDGAGDVFETRAQLADGAPVGEMRLTLQRAATHLS